jgi:hypothetical protein
MSRLRFFSILVLACLCVAAVPAFADTVFTDSTMSLGHYTTVGPFTTGLVGVTTTNCGSCGDTGGAVQIAETFLGAGNVQEGLLNNNFTYNPGTQGTILSITASVDKNIIASVLGGTNTFHPLIEQGGNYYIASIAGPTITSSPTGFNLISGNLTAASFEEYDFSTNTFIAADPNFNAGPMLFGLAQISGNGSNFETLTAIYDNLSYDISSAPVGTPEPSSLPLLAVGLLGVLGISSRKLLLNN